MIALVHAVAIEALVNWPTGGIGVRLSHHLFDLAETLVLGLVVALPPTLWTWHVRAPRWAAAEPGQCHVVDVKFTPGM